MSKSAVTYEVQSIDHEGEWMTESGGPSKRLSEARAYASWVVRSYGLKRSEVRIVKATTTSEVVK